MSQAAKSAAILLSLVLLLVLVAIWGWNAATEPFPGRVLTPQCVKRTIERGERVFADQVTVSVYNASDRNGLASRTMDLFTDASFGEGETGNAPRDARVENAQIWSEDPQSPAVRLVASRLGPGTAVVRREPRGVGVMVLVGNEFQDLVKGVRAVRADEEATVCGPPSSG